MSEVALTVEGQVSKYGSEEVHGEHPQNGNIANVLHSSLGWALKRQKGDCDLMLKITDNSAHEGLGY